MSERVDALLRTWKALEKHPVVDAREEFARARAALGHSVRHRGLAAQLAWLTLITPLWDRLDAGAPGALRRRIGRGLLRVTWDGWAARIARRIQPCDCDSRNPAVCSVAPPFEYWCPCTACHGPAQVGLDDVAVAGDGGDALAGDRSVAIAGYNGSAGAGEGGVIVLSWFDPETRRRRLAVGYVGEGGIKADTVYRVNERGEFFEEEPGSDQAVGQGGETGGET